MKVYLSHKEEYQGFRGILYCNVLSVKNSLYTSSTGAATNLFMHENLETKYENFLPCYSTS
jgi:hypothetical protein